MLCQPGFTVRVVGNTVAFAMVVDQVDCLLFAERRSRESRSQNSHRHVERQVGNIAFDVTLGQRDEQMGQRRQRHVVMPTRPCPRLVVGHAQVCLSVLEVLLHAESRAGHQRQGLPRRFRVGVRDVVPYFFFTQV